MSHAPEGPHTLNCAYSSSQNDEVFNGTADRLIADLRPSIPVAILRPDRLKARGELFARSFPGETLYAVKCNSDPLVVRTFFEAGVRAFDCASPFEIRLVRQIAPEAKIYFMHPVKGREAIREAYHVHGVRAFVLDHPDELAKILEETGAPDDLELFVRAAVPKSTEVATDFSSKFGAGSSTAAALLRQMRPHCARLGMSFHVGTQCEDPQAYARAVRFASSLIHMTGVKVDALDVGGGFPAVLNPAQPVPPMQDYFDIIRATAIECDLGGLDLLCEPGRALVADGGSLVVRVNGRKGDLLYINDGTYGGIFEAGGSIGLPYPSRLIRPGAPASRRKLEPFRLAGPTCDSVDMMKGPFMLPADIREGDWIELSQLGAYGEMSRTNFNGFGEALRVVMDDRAHAAAQQPQRSRKKKAA